MICENILHIQKVNVRRKLRLLKRKLQYNTAKRIIQIQDKAKCWQYLYNECFFTMCWFFLYKSWSVNSWYYWNNQIYVEKKHTLIMIEIIMLILKTK